MHQGDSATRMRAFSPSARLLLALLWVALVYGSYYLQLVRHIAMQQPALQALLDRF